VPLKVSAYDLKPSAGKGGVGIGEGDDPATGRLGPVPPCPPDPRVGLEDHLISVPFRDLDGPVI
jgi:hypothetical protein